MQKRDQKTIRRLSITGVAGAGRCIGRHEGKVIFVADTAPGDVVDILITREESKFFEGRPIFFHKQSAMRQEPFCEHFDICGGCKWQHIQYGHQATLKEQHAYNVLEKRGKLTIEEKRTILPAKKTTHYRNKLNYTFSHKCVIPKQQLVSDKKPDRRGVGFHVPGSFRQVFDVNKCWLQEDFSNKVRLAIRDFAKLEDFSFYDLKKHLGLLRSMTVRTSSGGEKMVLVQFAEDDPRSIAHIMDHLVSRFPEITSLLYVINPKEIDTYYDLEIVCYHGRDHIFEEMEGLKFKIGPKSFYQTNSQQAGVLYQLVGEFAKITKNHIVYDLYTGTGTIANFVARKAKKVVGVEYVPEAIEDARVNSQLNGIDNTLFYAGDMKDIFTEQFIAENGHPHVIITDPPRAGMHEEVIKVLKNIAAPRIVYISCNVNTMARDLEMLSGLYDVKIIQPVDMFPHTAHCECVGLLELKNPPEEENSSHQIQS